MCASSKREKTAYQMTSSLPNPQGTGGYLGKLVGLKQSSSSSSYFSYCYFDYKPTGEKLAPQSCFDGVNFLNLVQEIKPNRHFY